jgi:hypothetical protein
MDIVFYGISSVVALFLLLIIAEPYRFMPELRERKIKVGGAYWGVYPGSDPFEYDNEETIEVEKPSRKERPVYGSTTYALGRGVNMSGRK